MIEANIDNVFTPWFRFFIRHDPREALRKVDVPVLSQRRAVRRDESCVSVALSQVSWAA